MMKGKYQTLHGHTTASDGKMDHAEVLEKCEKYNIGVYAFTDHDSLPSKENIQDIKKYSGPTDWVVGIEISSGLPKEISGSGQHITGLFVDPFNDRLVEHCKKAQAARIERMKRIVKNLQDLGFEITSDDCIEASGGETVGRPHIVDAINSKDSNRKVIQEIVEKMKQDADKNPKVKDEYEKMLERGEESYPYALFLSSNAYIKRVYVDYLYRLDLDESVKLIRDAGGVALLAHWFTGKKYFTPKVIEKLFKENRLDGAETVYGVWSKDSIKKSDLIKDRKILQRLIKKYSKLEGGGIDCHVEKDLEAFSRTKWYVNMTVGMVEKIIASGKVETTWSSFS